MNLFDFRVKYLRLKRAEMQPYLTSERHTSAHPDGIIDLHLCQQFSINAEVAEAASLVVDDAVALTRH